MGSSKEYAKYYNKMYYEKHREREKNRATEYRLDNNDKVRMWNKRASANRKYPGYIDNKIIQMVYEDNIKKYGTLTCYLCELSIPFGKDSLEHKIPASKGGTNDYENLGVAHLTCNNKKHSKILIGLLLLLFSANAYADIPTINTISADSTASTFNANFTALKNTVSGQIQGSATTGSSTNILAASIGRLDMGAEVNPATRDSEILGIGVDSMATGSLVQASYVYTGLTPATSATLISDISAGTAYINGIRVVKTATSETYTASKDTYVDLSQTGAYTLSAVTNGATAPAVASNSARIAKVVTSATAITSVTDLALRRFGGLVTPTNYRVGYVISRDSTTVMSVSPGIVEINNTMLSTTTATSLNITTAGNWAGGSSLQAVSTYGYIGIDASGNIKMHTTAPTHNNYGVSGTAGVKRYATWSSTVYRILGWFYMNATGSGELDTWAVSSLKDGDQKNYVMQLNQTLDTVNDTVYGTDLTGTIMHVYSTGSPLRVSSSVGADDLGNMDNSFTTVLSLDSTTLVAGSTDRGNGCDSAGAPTACTDVNINTLFAGQGTHTITVRAKVNASSDAVDRKVTEVEEI